MPTGTVRFHRVLRTTPDKVYRAFTHGAALAKWLPPHGFVCHVHHFEGQVGGRFRMSFENFSTGHSHSFGGEYLQLVPGERVEYTDRFDAPNLPGEMRVTVKLRAVSCGTEVDIEQAGIPEVIPVEMCTLGWQESLAQLARLVEPGIPD
ncbi:SRPBCC family protein [Pseudorhodoferax sp.]|uniref:SRPBCC family protein n=1 Tax=Pseudorhodoferax sp. TaxID=1993553 RepID=UPI0039E7259A